MNITRLLQRFTQFAAAMLLSAIVVGNVSAQDIYVDSSGGSNAACNGTSPNVANIPNCPYQFLDFALTQASDGDVIEVAAGTYPNGPHVFGQGGDELTIQARNVNLNNSVILSGGVVEITENTTFLNAGSAGTGFFANGGVLLTDNTMSIDLPTTFNIPAGTTIERVDGDMDGNVTNNAAPTHAPPTMLTYTSTTVGIDIVAGNEVPATLGGGALIIDMTGGGTATLIFPTSFTAGPTTISGSNTANVTWSGTLTATSVTINDSNTHAFGGASVTGGDFLMTAGSTVSTGDLATNGNRLLQINAAGGSFTSTGTVSNPIFASNNGVLGDGGAAAWIVHDGATMILNDIDVSFATVGDGDGASVGAVS